MASYLSTSAHSLYTQTLVAAQYGPSEPPRLGFTSDFLYRCRYIAVAQIRTYGERSLIVMEIRQIKKRSSREGSQEKGWGWLDMDRGHGGLH